MLIRIKGAVFSLDLEHGNVSCFVVCLVFFLSDPQNKNIWAKRGHLC